jgi:hypothetical protein
MVISGWPAIVVAGNFVMACVSHVLEHSGEQVVGWRNE